MHHKPLISDSLLVSVVMPVLDNRNGFSRALKSVVSQPFQVEIIVIDGGSVDGTLDIIIENQKHIKYWETGKDSGISDAFNRGIKVASGELISILNSDDYWEFNSLEVLSKKVSSDSLADIYCGAIRYHNIRNNYQYVRYPKLEQIYKKMYVFHPAMFVRKSCYESVGLYAKDYTHAMDAEWVHRAISKQKHFVTFNTVLANMTLGGLSDEEYEVSLAQYRRSLIKNNISGTFQASFFYLIHLFQKKALMLLPLSVLKRLKDKLLLRRRED